MTDRSELIERLLDPTPPHHGKCLQAATAIRDLIAERDAAQAKGWNEAIEAAAKVMEHGGGTDISRLSQSSQTLFLKGMASYASAIRAMRKDTPQ